MPSAHLSPGPPVPLVEAIDEGILQAAVRDPLTGRPMTLEQLLVTRLRSDGLIVIHEGRVIAEHRSAASRGDDRHLVHSCSKSLTSLMIGIAVGDERLSTDQPMTELLTPLEGRETWHGVTLQHVLDMSTGHETDEHYDDVQSLYWRYVDAVGYHPERGPASPNGSIGFVTGELTRRRDEPGSTFRYSSCLSNLLPLVLEQAYDRPAVELYEEALFGRIGAEHEAIVNLDGRGDPIVEGQLSLTLRDFARWAWLLVDEGRAIGGEQVVPASWVRRTLAPDAGRAAAFARSEYAEMFPGAEYRNQTWLLDPAAGRAAMLGIHGQFAYVAPERGLLIAGLSSFPEQASPLLVDIMRTVWTSIERALA